MTSINNSHCSSVDTSSVSASSIHGSGNITENGIERMYRPEDEESNYEMMTSGYNIALTCINL